MHGAFITWKRQKRFVSLSRIDTSYVKRHKDRWHNDESSCLIVPETSDEIVAQIKRFAAKKTKTSDNNTSTQNVDSES